MIKRAFTEHPASVGETYTQHMGMAFGFGAKMVASGLACLLHGVFPFLFKTTGRDCIRELHDKMVLHRRVKPLKDGKMPPLLHDDGRPQAAE